MLDRFGATADAVAAPAARAVAVQPADGADLPELPKALYVGTGGNVAAQGADGATATFRNLADGTVLPFRARRVLATGTTAADILALL